MKIHPIQWRRDGFGTRLVALPANRVEECVLNYRRSRPSLICRHWQIWVDGVERRCIDRALTKKRALERIEQLKRAGDPLIMGGIE